MRPNPALLALAFFVLLPVARAQTLLYSNFSSTGGLSFTSVPGSQRQPDAITLAKSGSDRGSVFTTASFGIADAVRSQGQGFSAVFDFRITDRAGSTDTGAPSGAQQGGDGLAFVIRGTGSSSSLGAAGEGLGYQGIGNSVAVEFDTWWNFSQSDPSSNHYGINRNGSMVSDVTANETLQFDNGAKWTAWVDYNGTTLEVRANTTGIRPSAPNLSYALDLASTLGGTTAFIGFTAATGSATGTHQLLGFAFSDTYLAGGLAAVPEPSTYALILVGLGAVALAVRRRRS
jgi:hypothetical protein